MENHHEYIKDLERLLHLSSATEQKDIDLPTQDLIIQHRY